MSAPDSRAISRSLCLCIRCCFSISLRSSAACLMCFSLRSRCRRAFCSARRRLNCLYSPGSCHHCEMLRRKIPACYTVVVPILLALALSGWASPSYVSRIGSSC